MKVSDKDKSVVEKIVLVLADNYNCIARLSEDVTYTLTPYGCWHIIKVYQDGSCFGVATVVANLSEIATTTAEAIAQHFQAKLIKIPTETV